MLTPDTQYSPQVIGVNSTVLVKNDQGLAGGFLPTVSGTITVYDNTSGTSNPVLSGFAVTAGVPAVFGILCVKGINVTTAGGAAGTFLYN